MVEQNNPRLFSSEQNRPQTSLVELVHLLQSVNTDDPEAIQNETTMVNDLGERVKY